MTATPDHPRTQDGTGHPMFYGQRCRDAYLERLGTATYSRPAWLKAKRPSRIRATALPVPSPRVRRIRR